MAQMFGGSTIPGFGILPSSITLTGSPFTWTNNNVYDVDILVSAGTVSLIEWSRDEVNYFVVGLLAGSTLLSPGDTIRITYVVAPTVTQIPR